MAKALEVNDNTAQYQERQPQHQSGDKRNRQKLGGKALQVNENSVENQEPARSPTTTIVDNGTIKTEAETDLKTEKVCND